MSVLWLGNPVREDYYGVGCRCQDDFVKPVSEYLETGQVRFVLVVCDIGTEFPVKRSAKPIVIFESAPDMPSICGRSLYKGLPVEFLLVIKAKVCILPGIVVAERTERRLLMALAKRENPWVLKGAYMLEEISQ